MKHIIVILFICLSVTSCTKKQPETVSIVNLQITSPQVLDAGNIIAQEGTYNSLSGKFQFNWRAENPSKCGWMVNVTFHDGDDTRLRIAGLDDIVNVTATLPTGSMILNLANVPYGKLVQVNIVFDPIARTKVGHDQLTFYVRKC